MGETAEENIDTIIEIINDGKGYLNRWKNMHEKCYPEDEHNIPPSEKLDISNMKNSAMTTDTCNQATRCRRLMHHTVKEKVLESNGKNSLHYFIVI